MSNTRLTKRDFLKTAAGVTAVTAAATKAPIVLAEEPKTATKETATMTTEFKQAVLLNLQNLSGRQVRHDIPFDMNARTGNGIGISKRASGLIPSAPASPLIVSPV